jgi:nucleoid-associated protein YgaU
VSRQQFHEDATRDGEDRPSLEPQGNETVLRVNVSGYGLGALLMSLATRGVTGQLSLVTDVGRRTIYLHSGLPVFAQSSLVAERLGAIGVRHGFFSREDVARALSHGREQELELGQGLLDLGIVDAASLYALLGVQVREIVAAACGSAPQRARQTTGPTVRDAMILRLHPLTAVMMAVATLPAVERAKLIAELSSRQLIAEPLPALARSWLADLGYLGELNALTSGDLTLAAVRTRLRARYRAGAEKIFDPARSPFSSPGTRELCVLPASAAGVADLVALTLLAAASMRLVPEGRRISSPDEPLANTAFGMTQWLGRVSEQGTESDTLPFGAAASTTADRAIERYLQGDRERSLAVSTAVWGPGAEAADAALPQELLRLYVLLRSNPSPHAVLGVALDGNADDWMQGYARRTELLASLATAEASSLVRCRVAELRRRCDEALDALVSGTPFTRPSALAPASVAGMSSPGAAPAATVPRDSRAPSQAPPGAEPARKPAAEADPRAALEALTARVEGLMRAGHWKDVLRVLGQQGNQPLPFTLQLARAMAQREVSRRRATVVPALALFLLGAALGFVLRHLILP